MHKADASVTSSNACFFHRYFTEQKKKINVTSFHDIYIFEFLVGTQI
jgi:hypothetical protein